MRHKNTEQIRKDLSTQGRELLQIVVNHTQSQISKPGHPDSYLGYKQCCDHLGITTPGMDVPWGRLLQRHGLNDLNEWTIRHGLPAVSGLIVNQSGDRKFWPGGDYFASNRRNDMDFDWWEQQAKAAAAFDWRPYL